MNTGASVRVYGAEWCGDCRRSKRLLDRMGVRYDWIDISRDEEAADEAVQLSGRHNIPVITVADAQAAAKVLVEPSDPELAGALSAAGLLAQ